MDFQYEQERDLSSKIYAVECDNSNCIAHFHRSVELIYIIDGFMNTTINGETEVLDKNEIAFVSPYQTHCIFPEKYSRSITLIITQEYLHDFEKIISDRIMNPFLRETNYNQQILNYLKKIISLEDEDAKIVQKRTKSNLLLKGYIDVILGLILNNYNFNDNIKIDKTDIIINIINYLNENFKQDLTLEMVASHFGYSKFYFSKLFNKYLNCTFKYYLNTIRVKYVVKNMKVQKTSNNITNLAFEAGFDSLSTFYRHFNLIYKSTPSFLKKT